MTSRRQETSLSGQNLETALENQFGCDSNIGHDVSRHLCARALSQEQCVINNNKKHNNNITIMLIIIIIIVTKQFPKSAVRVEVNLTISVLRNNLTQLRVSFFVSWD